MMFTLASCQGQEKKTEAKAKSSAEKGKFPITKTDSEWRSVLTSEQYGVLRNKETERPHTGEYDEFFEKGTYVCAACGNLLFNSDNKFKSECGWPSFDHAIKGSVVFEHDTTYGMDRTEVMCAKCGGHLGHIFDDGPTETHMRYCTNSVSIKFIPAK